MSGSTEVARNSHPVLGRRARTSARPSPGAGHWPRASGLPLGSLPSAAPCARLHTKLILSEWNLGQVVDSAEIVVSELVTNALKASWSLREPQPIVLRLLASHEHLMILVWDALPAPPAPKPHAIDAECGRGLEIVALLSDRWGFYHPDSGGKIVWAALGISTVAGGRP